MDPQCDSVNDCALPSWALRQGDRRVFIHTVDTTTAGGQPQPGPPGPLQSRSHQTHGESEVSGEPTLCIPSHPEPLQTIPLESVLAISLLAERQMLCGAHQGPSMRRLSPVRHGRAPPGGRVLGTSPWL